MTSEECRAHWQSSSVAHIRPQLYRLNGNWFCHAPDQDLDMRRVGGGSKTPTKAFASWVYWQSMAYLIRDYNS